jgi:hypothetical protein
MSCTASGWQNTTTCLLMHINLRWYQNSRVTAVSQPATQTFASNNSNIHDVVEKSCPSQLRRGPLNYSDEGFAPSLFEGSKINLSRDFHIEASNVRMISSTAKNRSVASASSAQTMRPRVLPFGDNRPQATEKLGGYYQ